jgi:formylglycine-generating enzyme required for sulfatase activity
VADARHREWLLREARSAAAVNHPNVAAIYEVHDGPDGAFFVMELVEGETLRAQLARRGRLPVVEALDVASAIAHGLARAHALRVVHGDLKCENVMRTSDGHVKLLDFGLATTPNAPGMQDTEAGKRIAGTPACMAPEQARGDPVDARTDVYGFGVALYEMLSAELPFPQRTGKPSEWADASSPAWRVRPLAGVAPSVPRAVADLVARCLAHDRDDRPADGGSLVAELERLRASIGVGPRRARRWAGWGVAALLASTAIAWTGPRIRREVALRRALSASPPAGMALIDVGTIALGRTPAEVEQQCAEIGPTCDAERLRRLNWQIPAVRATIAPFYLDVHEVTNAEMVQMLNSVRASLTVAADDDYHFRRYVLFNSGLGHEGELLLDLYPDKGGIEYTGPSAEATYRARPGREHWPVVQVTWFGAHLYCARQGKRLPTDREWEAAARGRSNRTYPWGEAPIRCGDVAVPFDGLAPFESRCTTPDAPSDVTRSVQDVTPEGVYDLAGNVTEWVDTAASGVAVGGPDSQDVLRVTRGGSYTASLMARTSVRSRQPPNTSMSNTGFRCASNLLLETTNP